VLKWRDLPSYLFPSRRKAPFDAGVLAQTDHFLALYMFEQRKVSTLIFSNFDNDLIISKAEHRSLKLIFQRHRIYRNYEGSSMRVRGILFCYTPQRITDTIASYNRLAAYRYRCTKVLP
jgi:hypothetical protein